MAVTGLAVGATQPSQRELIQMFNFKEHVMNTLLSSPIFGQFSVGPNCGAEPHLSWWFRQHSDAKGVSGISERLVDPLPPYGPVGADAGHIGHVLFVSDCADALDAGWNSALRK